MKDHTSIATNVTALLPTAAARRTPTCTPARFALALVLCSALGNVPTEAASDKGLRLQFSAQTQPVTVTVSGIVRDEASGNPIANSLVRAHLVLWKHQGPELFEKCPVQEILTSTSGEYRIVFVTPLTTAGPMKDQDGLCVSAGANGYETQPQYARGNVTTANSSFTNFNFALKPGKKISGVVVSPAGQPVSGALVRVQNGMNGDWNFFGSMGRAVTSQDGSFQVWIGTAGEDYLGNNPWVSIVQPGIGTLVVWDFLKREDLGTLTLNGGGEITGKVVDAAGRPVPNCEVSVRRSPWELVSQALTDQGGNYHLLGIPGEPSFKDFCKRKNGRYDPEWGKVEVHARPSPDLSLKDAPSCKVTPRDGETVTSPDLLAGAQASVSGKLVASKTALNLGGLLVRLDGKWENMVEAGIEGEFRFPFVAAGKHTLTAYLPHNLRYDRGIGKARIEVQPDASLTNVQIQLADLAELRVQYLDAHGNPLPGISAAATWSKNGDGAWTEGTVSDGAGWAVLYLYPDSEQYIRGFDRANKLTAETMKPVKPQPGQVLEPLQIVMVPTATLSGRFLNEQGQALGSRRVLTTLNFADGTAYPRRVKTESDGRYRLEGIAPGVLKLSVEMDGVIFADPLGKSVEVGPGSAEDLGDIVLKGGLDTAKVTREKLAQAVEHSEELLQFAQGFFNKIRTADYDYFLQEGADWQRFPIVGYYQTYKWYDVLVPWISRTFKTNPIVNVELGRPFANPTKFNRKKDLPTVPYKLTLKDGTVLQGDLPCDYEFEGAKGHWFGIQGIDWHLQKEQKK
jgi:hypothetical protein